MVDGGERQRDVAAQFVALGVEQNFFEHLGLLLLEPLCHDHQEPADQGDRQQQRCDRQQQDLGLEFHACDCAARCFALTKSPHDRVFPYAELRSRT